MSKLKTLIFLTALFSLSNVLAAPQSLNIYAEDYFAADWAAGPKVKQLFEQAYPQCQVNYIPFDSRTTMLNRLRLEGQKTNADLLIGIDHHQLAAAEKSGLFAPNSIDLSQLALPIEWHNQTFLPYDFATYAFIYDKNKLKNPPQSLQELIARDDLKVIYQDPRTSSIGRGLVVWFNMVYAPEQVAEKWQQLATHTLTVGKGWSESYGAFLKGEGDLVLSNNTSPLYHLLKDNQDNYVAAQFNEGSPLQVELAAKIAGKNKPCADHFLQFLLTPEAQQEIVKKGVMLPVIKQQAEPHYDGLKAEVMKSKVLNSLSISESQLKQWIKQWEIALSK